MPAGLLELVPGRLYRLGGVVPSDGRISWLPRDRDGFEPVNAYLLLEGRRGLLVDTGVAVHGAAVVDQLGALLPPDATLSIFLTRIELDCVSNLGLVTEAFPVEGVYAGGVSNPFDFFEELESSSGVERIAKLVRIAGDGTIPLGARRALRLTPTKLRLLATTWGWDEATGTLFTSDSFGHVGVREPSQAALATQPGDLSAEQIYEHMVTKFDWLPAARTDQIRAGVRDIFAARDVTTVAPGHGCVLAGADLVREHVELVDAALAACGQVTA